MKKQFKTKKNQGQDKRSKKNRIASQSKPIQTDSVTDNPQEVEVLYQKLGDRWFAFSLLDDEVFFGSIHPVELDPKSQVIRSELSGIKRK
ncbi:MAG: hypothetical protein ACO3A2_01390 [Bdellovibrionia bacterium]